MSIIIDLVTAVAVIAVLGVTAFFIMQQLKKQKSKSTATTTTPSTSVSIPSYLKPCYDKVISCGSTSTTAKDKCTKLYQLMKNTSNATKAKQAMQTLTFNC
jgi:uncharacterized protein (UPF0333 family)